MNPVYLAYSNSLYMVFCVCIKCTVKVITYVEYGGNVTNLTIL